VIRIELEFSGVAFNGELIVQYRTPEEALALLMGAHLDWQGRIVDFTLTEKEARLSSICLQPISRAWERFTYSGSYEEMRLLARYAQHYVEMEQKVGLHSYPKPMLRRLAQLTGITRLKQLPNLRKDDRPPVLLAVLSFMGVSSDIEFSAWLVSLLCHKPGEEVATLVDILTFFHLGCSIEEVKAEFSLASLA